MHELALIIGLLLATVMAVGLGDKLRIPYPVLVVLIALGAGFIPGIPELHLEPDLILPLFLPPLLFATAKKTSWSVFRIRCRSVILLAIGLVIVTVAVVAGVTWLLIPGIGIPAAIALGAMVAPPDPVAVESVACRVHMPRRLLTVLQSEGLFNDAAAIVIFQAAVASAVHGREVDAWMAVTFLTGSAIAVALGLAMAWAAKRLIRFIGSSTARSAVTLVVGLVGPAKSAGRSNRRRAASPKTTRYCGTRSRSGQASKGAVGDKGYSLSFIRPCPGQRRRRLCDQIPFPGTRKLRVVFPARQQRPRHSQGNHRELPAAAAASGDVAAEYSSCSRVVCSMSLSSRRATDSRSATWGYASE